MKFAILGGSFNPIHMGHLFLADAVLAKLDYDRIILVPAFQSPFKLGAEGASASDRMAMLAASIPEDSRITIDDCEIEREGVSFTVDTLHDIIDRYQPTGKPGLILGDDLVPAFDSWKNPNEISDLADLIIARRLTEPENTAMEGFSYPYKALDNAIIDISSSMIRDKIKAAENWRYLVPQGARYIIEDRKMYGFTRDTEIPAGDTESVETGYQIEGIKLSQNGLAEIIAKVENDVRLTVSAHRFIHSRNTALLSSDLCQRFGLDTQKGYLAGIAHDICKRMGEKDLLRLVRSDGKGVSKLEKKKPGLLHARAGAMLLQKRYGITDESVLEAIRCHTTANNDMGALAKVIYIADKTEVSRPSISPALRAMWENADLETLFKAVLNKTIAHLKSRDLDLPYGTKRLLAAMNKRNAP